MPTAVGAARGPRHVFAERCMTELCMADPKIHQTVPGDPAEAARGTPPGALHARWVHQGRGTAFPGGGEGLKPYRASRVLISVFSDSVFQCSLVSLL